MVMKSPDHIGNDIDNKTHKLLLFFTDQPHLQLTAR